MAMKAVGAKWPNDILAVINVSCHESKMIHVAAGTITTDVIDDQIIGDRTVLRLPRHTMGTKLLGSQSGVSVTVCILGSSENVTHANEPRDGAWSLITSKSRSTVGIVAKLIRHDSLHKSGLC